MNGKVLKHNEVSVTFRITKKGVFYGSFFVFPCNPRSYKGLTKPLTRSLEGCNPELPPEKPPDLRRFFIVYFRLKSTHNPLNNSKITHTYDISDILQRE